MTAENVDEMRTRLLDDSWKEGKMFLPMFRALSEKVKAEGCANLSSMETEAVDVALRLVIMEMTYRTTCEQKGDADVPVNQNQSA